MFPAVVTTVANVLKPKVSTETCKRTLDLARFEPSNDIFSRDYVRLGHQLEVSMFLDTPTHRIFRQLVTFVTTCSHLTWRLVLGPMSSVIQSHVVTVALFELSLHQASWPNVFSYPVTCCHCRPVRTVLHQASTVSNMSYVVTQSLACSHLVTSFALPSQHLPDYIATNLRFSWPCAIVTRSLPLLGP